MSRLLPVLIVMLAFGCRTRLLDGTPAAADAALAVDAAPAADAATRPDGALGGSVSCGPGRSCAIAAGEHCCDSSPLACQTTPCQGADQFDCDGPEDCGGSPCCFPIRNAFSRAACAASCADGTVLCHSTKDCPQGMVCCRNFVLSPMDGECLGACD